jgi:hypothetical protein
MVPEVSIQQIKQNLNNYMGSKLNDVSKINQDSNMVFVNCLVITAYLLIWFSSIALAMK